VELREGRAGAVVVDCTIGFGGHSRLILELIQPGGRLLGVDRDEAALEVAEATLAGQDRSGPAPVLRRGDFRDLAQIAREAGFDRAGGGLFDLGGSRPPPADPARGVSFSPDGPLGMRLGPRAPPSPAPGGAPPAEGALGPP